MIVNLCSLSSVYSIQMILRYKLNKLHNLLVVCFPDFCHPPSIKIIPHFKCEHYA